MKTFLFLRHDTLFHSAGVWANDQHGYLCVVSCGKADSRWVALGKIKRLSSYQWGRSRNRIPYNGRRSLPGTLSSSLSPSSSSGMIPVSLRAADITFDPSDLKNDMLSWFRATVNQNSVAKQRKEWIQGIARSDYKGLLRKTITGLSRLQTSRVTIKLQNKENREYLYFCTLSLSGWFRSTEEIIRKNPTKLISQFFKWLRN